MLNARAKSLKQWFCTFQRLRIAPHQEHQLRALCLRSAAGYHRIQQRDTDLARDAAKFMDPCRGECGTFYRDGSGLPRPQEHHSIDPAKRVAKLHRC